MEKADPFSEAHRASELQAKEGARMQRPRRRRPGPEATSPWRSPGRGGGSPERMDAEPVGIWAQKIPRNRPGHYSGCEAAEAQEAGAPAVIDQPLPKNTKAISISDYFKRLDSGAV